MMDQCGLAFEIFAISFMVGTLCGVFIVVVINRLRPNYDRQRGDMLADVISEMVDASRHFTNH